MLAMRSIQVYEDLRTCYGNVVYMQQYFLVHYMKQNSLRSNEHQSFNCELEQTTHHIEIGRDQIDGKRGNGYISGPHRPIPIIGHVGGWLLGLIGWTSWAPKGYLSPQVKMPSKQKANACNDQSASGAAESQTAMSDGIPCGKQLRADQLFDHPLSESLDATSHSKFS